MNKTFRISRIRATHNRGYLTNEHEKLDEESGFEIFREMNERLFHTAC